MAFDNPIQESIKEIESTQESQESAIASPLLEDSKKSNDSADEKAGITPPPSSSARSNGKEAEDDGDGSGLERLKRHRVEVAGRVWIPDMWGQEDLLKDWIDCTAFDASLETERSESFREDGDDEEALRWAALERLPTYRRVRQRIFWNMVV